MSMCSAHSSAQSATHLNTISVCPLVSVPNVTGLLRPRIKHGPPACQSDVL